MIDPLIDEEKNIFTMPAHKIIEKTGFFFVKSA